MNEHIMENLKSWLRELGFSKNEIEVYVDLVLKGESSVLTISKRTGIHRSNIYEILDSLIKKGVVFEVRKDKKVFSAKSPHIFLKFIINKGHELEKILRDLDLSGVVSKQSSVGMIKGKFALREAIFSLLHENKPIYAFGAIKNVEEIFGPLIMEFHKERIKKKIAMKIISNSNYIGEIMDIRTMNQTEIRFFPNNQSSDVATFVCGKHVLLISFEEDVSIIEIEDEKISDNYQDYFNLFWTKSKPFQKLSKKSQSAV